MNRDRPPSFVAACCAVGSAASAKESGEAAPPSFPLGVPNVPFAPSVSQTRFRDESRLGPPRQRLGDERCCEFRLVGKAGREAAVDRAPSSTASCNNSVQLRNFPRSVDYEGL